MEQSVEGVRYCWFTRCLKTRQENSSVAPPHPPPPAPELPPSLLPVDFAIDSCGFVDAIPHSAAQKKCNVLEYVSSERKHSLATGWLFIVDAVGLLV